MRRIVAPLLSAVLLLSSAVVVSADSETQFDPVVCGIFEGGEMAVEPGSNIVMWSGWYAKTRGQIQSFMRATTWVVTVDGTRIDVAPYLDGPIKQDRNLWLVIWEYPLGPLDLGETMDVTLELVFNHPNFDGYSLTRAGPYFTSNFGSPVSCHLTGALIPEE